MNGESIELPNEILVYCNPTTSAFCEVGDNKLVMRSLIDDYAGFGKIWITFSDYEREAYSEQELIDYANTVKSIQFSSQ